MRVQSRANSASEALGVALVRLDSLVQRGLESAHRLFGPEAVSDPFRGLHIGPDDVERLMDREPGTPALSAVLDDPPHVSGPIAELVDYFGLETFDVDVLFIALGPEVDLRYERLFGYLQDDVTRKRPTVDLCLNLLCRSADERLERRARFAPEAPLVRNGLIRFVQHAGDLEAPLLGRFLKVDDRVVRFLLGQPDPAAPSVRDLGRLAELSALAQRIEPTYGWDEFVLPLDDLAALREICEQARLADIVYDRWGFGRKVSPNRGLTALFSGPPGTGKTMAAEIIALELGLPLYRIDISQVVSKYIGETEKNLALVFDAAEGCDAILFFDEADALFGRRSEIRDSHDRYSNIETAYLLQRVEQFGGIAILATNLRQNMDDAFVRRLQFIVDFPFPDEEHRHRIWNVMFPAEAPVGNVDVGLLARNLKLAGGSIRNVAVGAAFRAAANGDVIDMDHLAWAARREYQKLGHTWLGFRPDADNVEDLR
jgi:hypothetical protein